MKARSVIATLSTCLFLFCGTSVALEKPALPDSLNFDEIRRLPVQFYGRNMPLDTMARMIVWKVTGTEHFDGRDPVQVFLSWHFEPEMWKDQPIIPVGSKGFRKMAGLNENQRDYSHDEIFNDPEFSQLVIRLTPRLKSDDLNPLEKKALKLRERVIFLQDTFGGGNITFSPVPNNPTAPWRSINELKSSKNKLDVELLAAWQRIGDGFKRNDVTTFSSEVKNLMALLKNGPGHLAISPNRIDRELRYYSVMSLRISWVLMVIAGLWTLICIWLRRKWADWLTIGIIASGFCLISYHLYERGVLSGRLPAANFYESLVLIGWSAAGAGVVFQLFCKHRSVPLTSAGVATIGLIIADLLPISRFITPVSPSSLDSFWMAMHVPVIMISYAILAIAVGVAHAQVFNLAFAKDPKKSAAKIDALLYWYIMVGSLLLLTGILTGAVWATKVWGAYWKWDPKEVWSLVAFLAYMVILHVRLPRSKMAWYHYASFGGVLVVLYALIFTSGLPLSIGMIVSLLCTSVICYYFLIANSKFATATKSVLAFWTIIMTYVGVNYLLGAKDLGQYAFGPGATAKRVLVMGVLDLGILGICAVKYHRRSKTKSPRI